MVGRGEEEEDFEEQQQQQEEEEEEEGHIIREEKIGSDFGAGIKTNGKVGSIRWRPNDPNRAIPRQLSFAAATCNAFNNELSIYECSRSAILSASSTQLTPSLSISTPHNGSVTNLNFVDHSTILTSSTNGYVNSFQLSDGSISLTGTLLAVIFFSFICPSSALLYSFLSFFFLFSFFFSFPFYFSFFLNFFILFLFLF